MERNTPVRKPHTSTADLLTWPEGAPSDPSVFGSGASRSAVRSHQPSDGISRVVFGGQVTDEEVESLNKPKPCSGYKMKEMTGSGIFIGDSENNELESDSANTGSKTGLRMYQQAIGIISNISFGEEDGVTPKKPSTIPEVAKQRELSGNLDSESEAMLKKQLSDAKYKELNGHDIFAPPPEIVVGPITARTLDLKGSIAIGEPLSGTVNPSDEAAMKTAKKIYGKKFSDLSGNDVFKGDGPLSTADKSLSVAKLREMSGSDIFADGKVESRDYLGGVRKPPGGESSIALV